MTTFIATNQNSRKDLKSKVMIFSGIILLFIIVFLILWLPSAINSNKRCWELSEKYQLDRCENKFKQAIFVLGNTVNTPKPSFNDERAEILDVMYDGGKRGFSYISVSTPDATPKVIDYKGSLNKTKDGLNKQFSSLVADKDGADYLESIRMAAKYAGNKNNTIIYVLGSGLSDSGLLNFADDALLTMRSENEIEESLSLKLTNRKELEGLTVVWIGMGETMEPQATLNVKLRDKLKSIYTSALTMLGLDKLIILNSPSENIERSNSTSFVKPTPVEGEKIDFVFSTEDSELAFVAGTSDFIDSEGAKNKIQKIAETYPGRKYIVKSFMSRGWCTHDKDENLLSGRSNAVKNLLKRFGIPESNIRIEPGEIGSANECPNGLVDESAIEEEAKKNRYVKLTLERE